jgi:HK97 family phage major capsid protein
VTLTASKVGKILRVADEDLNDSLANIILSKTKDWGVSYAKAIDNACLAVTAAPAAGIPFSSVYYALTQSNSNTSYTANANLTTSATATYAGLSGSLAKYEQGDYFDEGSSLAIAHPRFKDLLRTLVDLQGRPLFVDAPANGFAGTLLGVPVRWSNGAKTSAVNTSKPAGHPLIVFGNRDFLILGKRSGPETAFAPPDSGAAFATDEALLKIRARRGFAVGNENAFSVYEYSGS